VGDRLAEIRGASSRRRLTRAEADYLLSHIERLEKVVGAAREAERIASNEEDAARENHEFTSEAAWYDVRLLLRKALGELDG
jgi:outer membrane murein-binding lipoprotein Lpp